MSATSRKALPTKLQKALSNYKAKSAETVFTILEQLNETFNKPEFKHDDIPQLTNEALYTGNTVSLLFDLLPFFEQKLLNSASTLLQSTIREFPNSSLPSYIITHPNILQAIFEYFSRSKDIMSVAHIIFRACCVFKPFLQMIFDRNEVMSFIQYLIFPDEQFSYLTTAFSTFDCILNTYPDISGQHVLDNWEIYAIQFKLLLASKQYVMHLNFLPILVKFFTNGNCRPILMSYLSDVENLQLIMLLMSHSSSKLQLNAYSLLKFFVINPRKENPVKSALLMNRDVLIRIISAISFEEDEQPLEEERGRVIAKLKELK